MSVATHCLRCGTPLVVLGDGPDAGRPACPRDGWIFYDNPAITTFAFVRHADRYLVLQRADEPCRGEWDTCGGFMEAGESPEQSVLRETLEETGLVVEVERLIGAYSGLYGDGGKPTVDLGYLCRASTVELTLSAEKLDARWVPLDGCPVFAFNGQNAAIEDLRRGLRDGW